EAGNSQKYPAIRADRRGTVSAIDSVHSKRRRSRPRSRRAPRPEIVMTPPGRGKRSRAEPRERRSAPAPRTGATGSAQLGEALLLAAGTVEVGRVEPALEAGLQLRPFLVDDRVPGGVARAASIDHRLPEKPFVLEP